MSQQLAAKHVPLPPLVLVVALVLIVMGCISLLFGYHTRHGAVLLFGLTIVAAVALHDFWHYRRCGGARWWNSRFSPAMSRSAAGLLLMVGMGGGPFAIDNRGRRRRQKALGFCLRQRARARAIRYADASHAAISSSSFASAPGSAFPADRRRAAQGDMGQAGAAGDGGDGGAQAAGAVQAGDDDAPEAQGAQRFR